MTAEQQYRVKATEFAALANLATSPALQTQYATMAAAYLRLADQAERNATTDLVYETPAAGDPESA